MRRAAVYSVGATIDLHKREFVCRQQEPTGYIITKFLDLSVCKRAADAGYSKPQMSKLVYQRERPRRLGVLIVENNEGRDVVERAKPRNASTSIAV